jgi:hypothetical protein
MTYYHEIFQENTCFNTKECIDLFQNYFPISTLETDDVCLSVVLEKANEEETINLPENPQKTKTQEVIETKNPVSISERIQYTIPTKKVSHLESVNTPPNDLFWQIYIGVYGLSRYIQIKRGYANEEINEKQKIIEYIKNNVNTIKCAFTKKITKVQIQDMMSSIITSKSFQVTDLFALSVYYNHRIVITKKLSNGMGVYLDFCPTNENLSNNILVIHKKNREFFLEENSNYDTIQMNMILLESYEKSLKAISNYKVSELNGLGEKVGVDMSNKYSKQELYMEILRLIGAF